MASSLGIDGLGELFEIGRGGFGVVYRAHQPALGRVVAVKVLVGVLDDRVRARFEREGHAMGALSGHPNIVTVYATGFTKDNQPYLVMEYLAAGSLATRLERDGPLPWPEALEIGTKLAGALEAAHRAGVLHRDIKPENVLISSYREPKLADFGIARMIGGPETRSGIITASLAHAPPEMLDGRGATPQSDVYSLCSMLFELVTGMAPFVRETDETVVPLMTRIATEPVADLRPRGIPDGFCTVLEAGMTKDPSQRIPTAEQLEQRLRAVATKSGVLTRDFHGAPLPGSPSDAAEESFAGQPGATPQPRTASQRTAAESSEEPNLVTAAGTTVGTNRRFSRGLALSIAGGIIVLAVGGGVGAALILNQQGNGGANAQPLKTSTTKNPSTTTTTTTITRTATPPPQTAAPAQAPAATACDAAQNQYAVGPGDINIRSSPNTSAGIIGKVPNSACVLVLCKTTGESIGGDNFWDSISYNGVTGYAADQFVNTGQGPGSAQDRLRICGL